MTVSRRAAPRPARWRRSGLVVLGLALVLASVACSSTTPSATPSTSAPPTTPSAPTGTGGATPTTRPAPVGAPVTPLTIAASTDGTSPDGAGCTPPAGDTLPDGLWFGTLKSLDAPASTIGFDLACWFSGDAANAAAAADDPGAEVPVPNDYYIRNQSAAVRTLHVSPQAAIVPLATTSGDPTGGFAPTQTGVAAATTILRSATPHLVWIQVLDGWVVVVQAQFTP